MNKKLLIERNQYKNKNVLQKYGLLFVFLFLCLILSLSTPNFLKLSNIINIFRSISIISILAFGATFVVLTGGIDLSLGSVVALTGVIAASLAHPNTYPLIVPIIAGIFVGVLIGLFIGVIVAYGRVPPFIATLGVMTAARGGALIIAKGRPILDLSSSFSFIGGGEIFGLPFPVIITLFVFLLVLFVLSKTKFGRYVYAIGGNEEASRAAGIKVNIITIMVYIICSGLAGLAGIIQTSRIAVGQPSIGQGYEMDAITAVVIGGVSLSGGRGSVVGTILGSLIIGVLNNGLDLLNVSSYWQSVVKGLIIIGAVLLDRKKKN
ncbi:MAG: ABC transporter permease [Clostridiaceae bacterium]|nr:ABC transporter permease [Clostridiaceae bacterium]